MIFMKRSFVLSLICCSFFSAAYCQLRVENNGNVGVKYAGTPSVNGYFTVNSAGDTETCATISSQEETHDAVLKVIKTDAVTTDHNYIIGFSSYTRQNNNSSRLAYGVYSRALKTNNTDTNSGRSYGVYSYAGHATPGWNYGVFGTLYGNNNGAGVFGSSLNFDDGMNTQGKFAGFFHGDVKSTDAMYASTYNVLSDYRLKENIVSIGSEGLNDLLKLNVVKYNLKPRYADTGDTSTIGKGYYTNESKLLERTHYGLLAQELQGVYPDLVYEGEDGFLSVNYIELIPILIKSVQELKAKVDALEGKPNNAPVRTGGTTQVTSQLANQAALYQNSPNPFTENTIIRCIIPRSISKAVLYIYDMNGHQIDSMSIAERGDVSLTIEGSSLDAGIYMYSLITDGEVVDTKRLILTK